MPAAEIIALALVAVVGSAAQSATGFGVALPVAPVAFALLAPEDAVLTVATTSLMHNVLVLAARRRRLRVRAGDAALLVAAALPGLLLGAAIVSAAPKSPMQLAVGAAILVAVALRLHVPGRIRVLAGRRPGIPIGLLSGTLTTTVGVSGPPLVFWLRARGATLIELRDTLAVVFLTLNVAAIPVLAGGGGAIPAVLLPALAAGLLAGHGLGSYAHRVLSTRALDRALVAVIAVAGGASLLAGAIGVL